MTKKIMRMTVATILVSMGASATVVDNFNNTNSALPDLTWVGNTNGFSVQASTSGEGDGVFIKTSAAEATLNSFVTDITAELASNPVWTFSGYIGADTARTVNGNNYAALVLLSDTTNAVAITDGTMNGYRLGIFTGDQVELQKASGAGWVTLQQGPSSGLVLQDGWNVSATIDSATGNYSWGYVLGSYTDTVLEGYAGNDATFVAPAGTTYGGFTYVVSTVDTYYVDAYKMTAIAGGGEPVPVAIADAYEMYSDITPVLSVDAPGVLENDAYAGTLALSALLVDNATNGVLNLSTNGSFTYEPDPDFQGTETFTYKAVTSATTSETATVSITVTKEQALLHYTFDTDLSDSSGNGNDGSYENTNGVASITNSSMFGAGSLSLVGSVDSNYVAFSAVSFSVEDSWSLSLWYNAGATNTAGLAGDNLMNNTLTYNPDGGTNRSYYLRAGNVTDVQTWTTSNSPTAIDTGTWHHLVMVATGSPAGSGDLTFYEDGVELSPEWASENDTAMRFNRVGQDANTAGFGGYFNGLIDEVWIMNYALGANDVASLYSSNTLGGGAVVPTPAEIVEWTQANSNSMKMVVQLEAGADASQYRPKIKSDLTVGTWDPVAHSDSVSGTYAISNLTYSSAEGSNLVIYVTSTNTVEFFNIQAE